MDLGDTDKYPKVVVLEVMQLTQTDHIELPSQVKKKLSQDVQLNSEFSFVDSVSS